MIAVNNGEIAWLFTSIILPYRQRCIKDALPFSYQFHLSIAKYSKPLHCSPMIKLGILRFDSHYLCNYNAFEVVVQIKTQYSKIVIKTKSSQIHSKQEIIWRESRVKKWSFLWEFEIALMNYHTIMTRMIVWRYSRSTGESLR